ncbi:hypothetical protein QOZ80_2BG0162080 [Eleusine coracana subsp. coracana]|nr:hypothetical protein QOZ80_2BG0162080 [Eleusine coracana subsp. coracana]
MVRATPPSLRDLQAQDGGGVMTLPLPEDAVYEVLLRLPAKDVCRFRAVCRRWRSLLSDPQFIAAHEAHHPGLPLVVAGYHTGYRNDGVVFDIVDLSGDVVRRVCAAGKENEWVTCVNHDFVCTAKGTTSNIRLFNMTTGAVFALPKGLAKEHAGDGQDILDYISVAAVGQVASTGKYKVLRILEASSFDDNPGQLCEVFTLDGSDHARWRSKNAPPDPVSMTRWKSVVASGIVYFFGQDSPLAELCSFDLEREQWRRDLQGPNYQQLPP